MNQNPTDTTKKENETIRIKKDFELDYSEVLFPQLVWEIKRQSYKSLNQFCKKAQINQGHFSEVIRGKRTLTNKFKLKVAETLKIDSVVIFSR